MEESNPDPQYLNSCIDVQTHMEDEIELEKELLDEIETRTETVNDIAVQSTKSNTATCSTAPWSMHSVSKKSSASNQIKKITTCDSRVPVMIVSSHLDPNSISTKPSGILMKPSVQLYSKQSVNTFSRDSTNSCRDQQTQLEDDLQKDIVKESESQQEIFKEIAIQSIDLNVATCSNVLTLPLALNKSCLNNQIHKIVGYDPKRGPIIVINSPMNKNSITIKQSTMFSSPLSSAMSIPIFPLQPQSLFLLALATLNQSSNNLATLNKSLKSERIETENTGAGLKSPELTPPDSLTSAPPSYSFVLRQSAARRRPRLLGTFFPSPSFVTPTPPPNYAAAFDVYVDTPIQPPQPPRVYTFGFTAMPVLCPQCGFEGLTAIISKVTLCTHLCALILCLFCCWVCAPLPYIMTSCKDVYHYCRNCRYLLGMYSPANPETSYPIG